MKNSQYKKIKTTEEVMFEMSKRQQKIEKLSADLKRCESFEARMLIVDQMIEVANEVSELNSRNNKIVLRDFKKSLRQLLKDSIKRLSLT